MQFSFNFDIAETDEVKKVDLEVGEWLSDEDVEKYKGRLIPFQELEEMKGKIVLREYKTSTLTSYKPVLIINYWHDIDTVYKRVVNGDDWYGDRTNGYVYSLMSEENKAKFVPDHKYDKVGYCDKPNKKKSNSWCGEIHCLGGRWKPESWYDGGFYEVIK